MTYIPVCGRKGGREGGRKSDTERSRDREKECGGGEGRRRDVGREGERERRRTGRMLELISRRESLGYGACVLN